MLHLRVSVDAGDIGNIGNIEEDEKQYSGLALKTFSLPLVESLHDSEGTLLYDLQTNEVKVICYLNLVFNWTIFEG